MYAGHVTCPPYGGTSYAGRVMLPLKHKTMYGGHVTRPPYGFTSKAAWMTAYRIEVAAFL